MLHLHRRFKIMHHIVVIPQNIKVATLQQEVLQCLLRVLVGHIPVSEHFFGLDEFDLNDRLFNTVQILHY